MLSVVDCSVQFLYERKRNIGIKTDEFNICERKMSGSFIHRVLKEMRVERGMVDEVHF